MFGSERQKGVGPARFIGTLLAVPCMMASLVATGVQATADEIADFYKGKQMTIIVSAGANGGFGKYARTFAPAFEKNLPGNPSMIVRHMTGAGGIVATNHLYANAAQDGSAIGFVHSGMTTADILMPERVQFDTRKFHWLGSMDNDSGFCASWHAAGVKDHKQLKASKLIMGSAGAGSTQDIHARILKRLWAPNIQVVSGYKSGGEVYIAMERGEVEGRCGLPISSLASTRPDWLTEKKVNFLILFGLERDKRYPDVPTILDVVDDADTRAALELILAARSVARPVLAPPGVPAERVAALRKAFDTTMNDPEFLALAKKRKLTIDLVPGEKMQKMIEKLHQTPKSTVKLASDLVSH